MSWLIAKLIISNNAQDDLMKILENVVDHTSHAASGVKHDNEIYEKLELIAIDMMTQEISLPVYVAWCMRKLMTAYKPSPSSIQKTSSKSFNTSRRVKTLKSKTRNPQK